MLDQMNPLQHGANRVAVSCGTRIDTFGEIERRAAAIQQALLGRAIQKIAIYLPYDVVYIAAFWSAVVSDVTIVPLNNQLTTHELDTIIAQSETRVLLTAKRYHDIAETLAGISVIYVEDLCNAQQTNPLVCMQRDPHAVMVLLCTSGTTGHAKLVQLSQHNIEVSLLGYLEKMGMPDGKEKRFLYATPFSSAYGIMMLGVFMVCGDALVLLSEQFTLGAFYRAIAEHKITHYEGAALPLHLMCQRAQAPNPYDISSLVYMGFGGSGLSEAELRILECAYPNIKFCMGYGMSEAAPLISKHPLSQVKKTHSSGTAIDGVEIFVEADGVLTREPNVTGELVIRGETVMRGYYHDQAGTEQVLRDGYLYSGDIGYVDEEGYVFLIGRKKNIMITRGFNVHPEEIEGCLLSSGLASDCIAYGATDAYGQERIHLDVVRAHEGVTVQQIQAYCATHLAQFKWPHEIHICDHIARNEAGKAKRHHRGQT